MYICVHTFSSRKHHTLDWPNHQRHSCLFYPSWNPEPAKQASLSASPLFHVASQEEGMNCWYLVKTQYNVFLLLNVWKSTEIESGTMHFTNFTLQTPIPNVRDMLLQGWITLAWTLSLTLWECMRTQRFTLVAVSPSIFTADRVKYGNAATATCII